MRKITNGLDYSRPFAYSSKRKPNYIGIGEAAFLVAFLRRLAAFFLVAFLAVAFFLVAFFLVAFLAVDFLAAFFLVAFFLVAFLAVAFLAAFFLVAFFFVAFFAVAFFLVAFFLVAFLAGLMRVSPSLSDRAETRSRTGCFVSRQEAAALPEFRMLPTVQTPGSCGEHFGVCTGGFSKDVAQYL